MYYVPKVKPYRCQAHDPNGDYIGMLNVYEFYELRVHIKKNQIEGYSFYHEGRTIRIDKNGGLESWPLGFYDQIDVLLDKLLE